MGKLKIKNNKGFTLIEMMIAVALFALISSFAIGAVLSIFDANRKAQSSKTIVDNLNFSIENMARTVRFGSNYHCGSSGSLSSPNDCSTGDAFLAITFYDKILAQNVLVAYRLNGTAIEKSYNGGSYIPITAPEANIQYLKFYVFGTNVSDSNQPYVIVVIKGYVGSRSTTQTVFSIETLMSQRALDI